MNTNQFLEWLENNHNVNNWYESKRTNGDKVIIVILDGEDLEAEDIEDINDKFNNELIRDEDNKEDLILTVFLDDLMDAINE